MDRVAAASSICQPSLHALHTEATAATVCNRATQQLNVFKKTKLQRKTVPCLVYQPWKASCLLSLITFFVVVLLSINTQVNWTHFHIFYFFAFLAFPVRRCLSLWTEKNWSMILLMCRRDICIYIVYMCVLENVFFAPASVVYCTLLRFFVVLFISKPQSNPWCPAC